MAQATVRFTMQYLRNVEPEGREVVVRDSGQRGLAVRVRRDGDRISRTLFVVWYERRKTRKFSLGRPGEFKNIDAIRTAAAEVMQRVKAGEDPSAERRSVDEERTVQALYDRYMAMVERTHRRPDAVLESLVKHALPRFKRRNVTDLKRAEINDWFHAIEAPVAANRALAWFKAMLNYAVIDLEWIDKNPALGIKKNAETPRTNCLDAVERERFDRVIRTHARDLTTEKGQLANAALLMLHTGARVTEITNARWSEVTLEAGVILKPVGKNGKPRVIHLDSVSREILSTIPREEEAVFPRLANRRPNVFSRSWHALRDEAEVPKLQMRDLRRTFATDLHNDGAPIEILSKALSHSSLGITQQVYAHLRDDRVAAVLARREAMVSERGEAANA